MFDSVDPDSVQIEFNFLDLERLAQWGMYQKVPQSGDADTERERHNC